MLSQTLGFCVFFNPENADIRDTYCPKGYKIEVLLYLPGLNLDSFSPPVLQASGIRRERDTFGELEVPADRYWGAQTARSKMNFDIGGETERIPVSAVYVCG